MKSVVSLVLTIVLLVVIILDGAAMFVAYQSSKELAQSAAQQAAIQFVTSGGNQTVAEQLASEYVSVRGGELLSVSFHSTDSRWVETAVRSEADTYVFHYVPVLNRFIDQDAVAIIQF